MIDYGKIRPEVWNFVVKERETLVREVLDAAGRLPVGPWKRTVAGCLKVLGDRFGGVNSHELLSAALVVQLQCALSLKECRPSDSN